MNYRKSLIKENIEVQSYLVRNPGEREDYSIWKEVHFHFIPSTYEERIEYINMLAEANERVFVKTATVGGRMRIFVQLKDGNSIGLACKFPRRPFRVGY